MANGLEKFYIIDMIKKYLVLNSNGKHEYDITTQVTDNGELISLSYSINEMWSLNTRGKLILSMCNDGNGIVLSKEFLRKIDYSELVELRILLSFENYIDGNLLNKEKYKIVENTTICEI